MALLTRALISSDAYLEHFDGVPKEILWTKERIENSFTETMRARPQAGDGRSGPGDIWIFGYGSLIWNPLLNFNRRHWAFLHGWHRSFCLRMIAGRGCIQMPGRMLALEPGGTTLGVAFRLSKATAEEELRLVWAREMQTGVYRPIWSSVMLEDGREAMAIAFVADPTHPLYEKDPTVSAVAPLIIAASGSLGTNADYVFNLQAALARSGRRDDYVDALADELRRLRPGLPAPSND